MSGFQPSKLNFNPSELAQSSGFQPSEIVSKISPSELYPSEQDFVKPSEACRTQAATTRQAGHEACTSSVTRS